MSAQRPTALIEQTKPLVNCQPRSNCMRAPCLSHDIASGPSARSDHQQAVLAAVYRSSTTRTYSAPSPVLIGVIAVSTHLRSGSNALLELRAEFALLRHTHFSRNFFEYT